MIFSDIEIIEPSSPSPSSPPPLAASVGIEYIDKLYELFFTLDFNKTKEKSVIKTINKCRTRTNWYSIITLCNISTCWYYNFSRWHITWVWNILTFTGDWPTTTSSTTTNVTDRTTKWKYGSIFPVIEANSLFL